MTREYKTNKGGKWDETLAKILELFKGLRWTVVPYTSNQWMEVWEVTCYWGDIAYLCLDSHGFSMSSGIFDSNLNPIPLKGEFKGGDCRENFIDLFLYNNVEIKDLSVFAETKQKTKQETNTMSIRLTKESKAEMLKLLKELAPENGLTSLDFLVNPSEGLEFHEGAIAGLMVSLRILCEKDGSLDTPSGRMISVLFARYLEEIEKQEANQL